MSDRNGLEGIEVEPQKIGLRVLTTAMLDSGEDSAVEAYNASRGPIVTPWPDIIGLSRNATDPASSNVSYVPARPSDRFDVWALWISNLPGRAVLDLENYLVAYPV